MNRFSSTLFVLFCWSCTGSNETEKYQSTRNNINHVKDKIEEIKINDPLISSLNLLYLMDDYLIIQDMHGLDELIHLFDKNKFKYVTSIAYRGQGPNEITNMGLIAVDETHRKFYVTDHGKQRVLSFDLDSVVSHAASYMPEVKMKMDRALFPDYFQIVNDSISIGKIIQPIGSNNFKPRVGKMNMNTGEITLMKYEHPKITERKRSSVAVSIEHGIYVEYYNKRDLLTICNLDGDLICNIYGPNWDPTWGPNNYYSKAVFCGDKIYAAYLGERGITEEGHVNRATKLLVFDLQGNYIQTLETGLHINDYCYDKDNNRIILSLEDEIQFAYLPLD